MQQSKQMQYEMRFDESDKLIHEPLFFVLFLLFRRIMFSPKTNIQKNPSKKANKYT